MKQVPLSQGKFALVDDEDFEWLNQWKWYAYKKNKTWYVARNIGKRPNRKLLLLHRLITNAPSGMCVDHADGNGLNNTRSNLRIATNQQNGANRGKDSDNTSGYKGVVWCKDRNKWEAIIRVNRKSIHLGRFSEITEAAKAYDDRARKEFGEFARTNF